MSELNTEKTAQVQTEESETAEKRTYTEEEFQSEIDRRVTSALAKQQRKNEAKLKEAEKLANMNADQRFQYELEQREQAIAEKERQLTLAENTNAASKILAEKGLSLKLVDFVVADEADEMDRRIKLLDTEFKKSVRAEVEKRLGAGAPKSSNTIINGVTKEQFAKMTLSQKQNLKNTDRDLYDTLTGKLK